jgi:hopene-associated glycosyltransferase HpnB
MIIFLAAICCAAWLYLIALHGRFWNSGPILQEDKTLSTDAKVAVVVPARDEAENIGSSIRSLLAQEYPGELSVILVDDNSTDGTAEIAASLPDQGRLTIISGQPLPAGWSGKLWAVHQGLMQPEAQRADYILLTDADIEHATSHMATLVREAEANGQDLVSEMVRLHCSTPAERALIPAFIFFFQMLYPFAWVADSHRAVAGAAGGTMLIRRAALERIDGVRGIRHHLIDDCALARQIKSSGGKIWLGHAELARSLRVYADWHEIWNMIARTAYVQLGHSLLMLLGCIAGMGLLYVAPVLLTLSGHGLTRVLAAAAWLIMAIAFQPTLRRYGRSPLWGVALPGVAIFYLGATITSAFRHHVGRGGGWKNRTYPEAPS